MRTTILAEKVARQSLTGRILARDVVETFSKHHNPMICHKIGVYVKQITVAPPLPAIQKQRNIFISSSIKNHTVTNITIGLVVRCVVLIYRINPLQTYSGVPVLFRQLV